MKLLATARGPNGPLPLIAETSSKTERSLKLGPADQWLSRLLGGVRAAILLSCETDSPMGRAHGGLYAEECDSY